MELINTLAYNTASFVCSLLGGSTCISYYFAHKYQTRVEVTLTWSLLRYSTWVSSSSAHKYQTQVKLDAIDKHASLQYFFLSVQSFRWLYLGQLLLCSQILDKGGSELNVESHKLLHVGKLLFCYFAHKYQTRVALGVFDKHTSLQCYLLCVECGTEEHTSLQDEFPSVEFYKWL